MRVIINADDFGLTKSCTEAISKSFEQNLITDTTMVANGDAFSEAVSLYRDKNLEDKVGIHFNITEGKPLTEKILNFPEVVLDGVFHGKINRYKKLSKSLQQAIYEEFTAQVERIKGAGIKISHADSHHHIHTAMFVAPIFKRVCIENGIDKVRLHRNVGKISFLKKLGKKRYNKWLIKCGFKTTKYFAGFRELDDFVLADMTELMVHPDFDEKGVIVDRVDVENGFAVGDKLYSLGDTKEIELFGYRDL